MLDDTAPPPENCSSFMLSPSPHRGKSQREALHASKECPKLNAALNLALQSCRPFVHTSV